MEINKEKLSDGQGRADYVAPRLSVRKIELENGIAAGSVNPATKQQWEETETQSHTVDNNSWD
ncbi:MAG: hypothetical protein LBV59_09925 [Sphingobacterium sp.]|jgi:hypothetical protein|uniref:hypothetical protein n=1 Tax=unclassified Sphingobacterium TaxID=2609468 RepID=UPI00283CA280|nr:hypothetical protein [Sphingobacterium sp.]MDR3008240.1 hypothetical protein [Sphingobacterium sp.]